MENHQNVTIEQFTQQAVPFTQLPAHSDSIQLLLDCAKVSTHDNVLDVACGPGLVACAFARESQLVTGIDLTPRMLELAQEQQRKQALSNMLWLRGDVDQLPFANESFSLVITRYSFHHFANPEKVLREMMRVCQPGGKILIADVALPAEKCVAYDRLEKLRDPSHVHALSFEDWERLFRLTGLTYALHAKYEVEVELEEQLEASFPEEGNKDRIRQLLWNDVEKNALGVNAQIKQDKLYFSYPIAVYRLEK